MDAKDGAPHPLLEGAEPPLDNYPWQQSVPVVMGYEREHGALDPVCFDVPPGRARTPADPGKDDLLLWETDVSAMGVRHCPEEIGWAAAMTREDKADVGSYYPLPHEEMPGEDAPELEEEEGEWGRQKSRAPRRAT